METIYYNLDARRLTVYDMASGEAAPAPRDMLFLRTQPRVPQREGKVLDFDACRRALTGEETPLTCRRTPGKRRRRRFPPWSSPVSAVPNRSTWPWTPPRPWRWWSWRLWW